MNLDAIRAKLKVLEEGKTKSRRWKPSDEHTVRVLPLPDEEDLSMTVKWHYGVDQGRQMYCPSTHGDNCAFCDLAQFLRSWKDENGKDKTEATRKRDWDIFKKVEAAVKHYVPVVVRKKNSDDVEGPYLWEMTPKTYTALFKICANDERNDDHPDGGGLRVLTSLMHGVDLVVNLKKKGEKGNQTSYDLTEVEPRMKTSAIFKGDKKSAEELLKKIPNLSEIAKVVTTDEAQKVFSVWEGSVSGADTGNNEPGVEHGRDANAEQVQTGGLDTNATISKLEALLNKNKSA